MANGWPPGSVIFNGPPPNVPPGAEAPPGTVQTVPGQMELCDRYEDAQGTMLLVATGSPSPGPDFTLVASGVDCTSGAAPTPPAPTPPTPTPIAPVLPPEPTPIAPPSQPGQPPPTQGTCPPGYTGIWAVKGLGGSWPAGTIDSGTTRTNPNNGTIETLFCTPLQPGQPGAPSPLPSPVVPPPSPPTSAPPPAPPPSVPPGCPAPVVCPSPPPPPPPPAPTCGQWQTVSFAPPGSAQWCKDVEQIAGAIRDIGLGILDWIDKGLSAVDVQLWGAMNDALPSISGITDIPVWLGKAIYKGFAYVTEPTVHFIRCALEAFKRGLAVANVCDPNLYAGIAACRLAWVLLRDASWGSDIWVAVHVHVGDSVPLVDRILDYLERWACPSDAPTGPDVLEAYLMDRIGEDQYKCWMRMHGRDPVVWQPILDARREQLTTDEIIDNRRRQDVPPWGQWHGVSILSTEEQQREIDWFSSSKEKMRSRGWLYQEDADPRYALYDELPTISDHLHWLARNIDDYEYVRDYHLLDGFDNPALITEVMSAEGIAYTPIPWKRNFWLEFGAELRAQGMRKVDAMRHYAAHWLHGSPGQMKEFAWRLRPDRPRSEWDKGVAAYFAGLGYPVNLIERATTFTPDDYRRLLTEQDYAPLDVAWFLSTLYHVPALSYLRDMYRYGTITEADLQGYHQDLGYSLTDSERFVDVDRKIKARVRTAEAFAWTPSALSRAYGLGLIDEATVDGEMQRQGFNGEETTGMKQRAKVTVQARYLSRALSRSISRTITQVSQAYSSGVLDLESAKGALTAMHIPAEQAQALLDMEALRVRTKLANEVQRTVRSAYLKGKVDKAGAIALLQSAGVTDNLIQAEMAAWDLEQLRSERAATIAELRRWVLAGLMTPEEARVRLTNLNIPDADAQLLVEEIIQKVTAAQLKEQEIADRIAARRQADLAKAANEAAAAQRRAVAALMKQEPVAKLEEWLRQGIITRGYFTARLTTYGYSADAIALRAESACARRGANCVP